MSSSVETESVMTCTACGASIYQEHIDRGLAGMWGGQMLCPACLRERKEAGGTEAGENESGSSLRVDESEATGPSGLSVAEATEPGDPSHPPSPSRLGRGARRIRTFHARLSEGAVRHLDEQVNAWLESHPEIEIRFAHSTIGVWEGKHAEPNLILTIFY